MNMLLDSHALLWALHDPGRLSAKALAAIQGGPGAVFFSAASAWELEIKASRGKLDLPDRWLRAAEEAGFLHLPVTAAEASAGARLPWHHTDPFDRLLVAQANAHALTLVSRDATLAAYGVPLLAA